LALCLGRNEAADDCNILRWWRTSRAGQRPEFVASPVHESGFQSAEAAFHRCIVLSNFPSSSWIGASRPRREPCGRRQRHIGCRDRSDGSAQDRGGDRRVPEGHRALSRYALPHHNLAIIQGARKAKPRRRTPRTQRPKDLAQNTPIEMSAILGHLLWCAWPVGRA
jgi:hypothetical protein